MYIEEYGFDRNDLIVVTAVKAYLKKLETKTASDPVKEYESKKILMDLIRSEDYLYLSDNREIRDTYIRIRNVIGELYNTYMSIVR